MTNLMTRSRLAAGLASLFLEVVSSAAIAATPVTTADPEGGVTYNAGATPPNTVTTDGTTTGGSVQQNSDGTTADANMYYTSPSDGSTYTGTGTVTSYDQNGVQIAQATQTVTVSGNGGTWVTGYAAITLPVGGSILIRVNASNGCGGFFTAGFRLRNFQP